MNNKKKTWSAAENCEKAIEIAVLIAARRHDVDWPAGFDYRFSKSAMAALNRILELEDMLEATKEYR